jgi:acetyl esterase/lipase
MKTWLMVLCSCFALCTSLAAQEKSPASKVELRLGDKVEARVDLPYAGNTNPRQRVDLFLPANRSDDKPLPVVVLIHGGGWIGGDRKGYGGAAAVLAATGKFAAVSVGYRMSNEAKWPAQIHDCKAAIRWIRGHAKEYNLDPNRIGATGASAGGHLVTMLGVTADNKELEGELGEFKDQSSAVTCVVNFCGPSDMTLPLMQGDAAKTDDPAVSGLVGGSLKEKVDVVKSASPINYITAKAVPIMTVHGTKDARVNYQQAEILHAALSKAGATSLLIPVTDAGHGIPLSPELLKRVQQFWNRYLLDEKNEISTEPISK